MTATETAASYETCGAHTRSGGKCKRPAGWGTTHPGIGACKLHLGSTGKHKRAAELVIARQECDRLGIPVHVDPGEALIRELWETAGNVAFYRELVQRLREDVFGETFHVSGERTGEAKAHVLVQLYNEERKHLANVAASALKAGVEERRVRLAEQDADWVISAQVQALVAIGMGDRLEDFRRAFANALGGEPVPAGAAIEGRPAA